MVVIGDFFYGVVLVGIIMIYCEISFQITRISISCPQSVQTHHFKNFV